MSKIRVLIVDDHAMFRDGLRAVLEQQDDLQLVGEAGDAGAAVRLDGELKPDVILMDLHLPGRSGIEAMREILARRPATCIIVLTMYQDDELIAQSFQAGAAGYILKDSRVSELVQSIRTVMAGGAAVDPSVAVRVLAQYRRLSGGLGADGGLGFSERELTMLVCLVDGLSNRAIAERLFLSEQTVKNHLSTIYQKLGVANRTQAALAALQRGIIPNRSA